MPLVNIHVIEGQPTPAQLRALADVVQDVMLEHFAAPTRDRHQIITEHQPGLIIAEDTGLGYNRTNEIVVIQIFQQGRNAAHKQAVYAALADRLDDTNLVNPNDLIVSIVANSKEDWSFGGGKAHFLTGDLS